MGNGLRTTINSQSPAQRPVQAGAQKAISYHYSWKHSGFNLHAGEIVPRRPRLTVEKMTLESPGDIVIYRSRLNAKINRNFEVFTPTDFLAAITQHIPDKGSQMVCYYGWYSNKMRGVRQRGLPPPNCSSSARASPRPRR